MLPKPITERSIISANWLSIKNDSDLQQQQKVWARYLKAINKHSGNSREKFESKFKWLAKVLLSPKTSWWISWSHYWTSHYFNNLMPSSLWAVAHNDINYWVLNKLFFPPSPQLAHESHRNTHEIRTWTREKCNGNSLKLLRLYISIKLNGIIIWVGTVKQC